MKLKKTNILFLLLLTFSFNNLLSQNHKEVFTKKIFISKDLSGVIKLYDNGVPTFTPFDKDIINKHFDSISSKFMLDTMKIFSEYWSNSRLYPYKDIDLSTIKDSIFITLDSNDFYCSPSNYLYSPFGPRRGRQHKGIDTDLDIGDTLRTMFSGKVRYANFVSGFGNLVIVRHSNGLETYYAHLDKILVEPNQILGSAQVIGLGGETGNALGPHLHFEFRYKDNPFNPEKILDLKKQKLKLTKFILTSKDFEWKKQWRERKYHKVKSGETLSHISVKYNTSTKKILKLNKNLKINSILQIGQKIRVR